MSNLAEIIFKQIKLEEFIYVVAVSKYRNILKDGLSNSYFKIRYSRNLN